jgi:eukaryotic-like serine/threonine-protein kinase
MSFRPPLSVLSPDAPMHPARLGKYTLSGVLGEGAMGIVYKGFDPVIRRPVAVKAIRRHLFESVSSNVSAAERFRNEAQAAGRLSHPGIVGVYEYGEEEGVAFIAMEYIEGRGLHHYITPPARLSEPEALCVMTQLLDALHCAHEQGVWHRDIKPNNIIVTPDGRLKIADFGIARIESAELTHMKVLFGSPGYIAPERYTGETAPDRRVDIFSCGVLLYQMLTGIAPFAGSEIEAMYKVLHNDPKPPSCTGTMAPRACWDAIVAKALAKRPEDRYATAREFRDALVDAAPWPIPAMLSIDAIDATHHRLPEEPATAMQIGKSIEMSKEHAGIAELVAQVVAKARARAEQTPDAPGTAAPRLPCSPPTLMVPLIRRAAPTPEAIAKTQRVLAGHIGPIATLMVKSAVSIATTRDQFHLVLADLAADCVDRDQLLAELSRIG